MGAVGCVGLVLVNVLLDMVGWGNLGSGTIVIVCSSPPRERAFASPCIVARASLPPGKWAIVVSGTRY